MSEDVTPPPFEHSCGGDYDNCTCYEQYEDYLADGGWAE